MYIPECLVQAMGGSCTGVKIYCEEGLRERIKTHFVEVFDDEYEKLLDLIEKEEGSTYEKEEGCNPLICAEIEDDGVFLCFDSFAMYCGEYGDFISMYNGGEAMEEALGTIKKEFPSIRYEGYVAYCWSDIHSGDIVQYEVSSENENQKNKREVIYDFVGRELSMLLELEDEEVWDSLSAHLEDADENEYKKIIKLFHIYSQWIPSDTIERVIELSAEFDEDLTESLQKFADALRAGEDVDIEEDEIDTSGLPDGYMEALDMFVMAEDIRGEKPKRGEIISSDDTFGFVIEKAESGDAEAKFTAGKYFIADHIEEETERAIRWIREAAESGVEEAQEYMKKHGEMF